MVQVRPQLDGFGSHPSGGGCSGGGSGLSTQSDGRQPQRLNLLLSCATWKDDTWADALPRLLEPMGVSSVRARSAREAERVIRLSPVHIAVVDLGLPLSDAPEQEEAGARILDLLMRLSTPPPTVVVRSPRPARESQRDLSAALRCGVFSVIDRQAATLETMLQVMQRCLCRFYHNRWPGTGTSPA